MAHHEQLAFVEAVSKIFPDYFDGKSVLEIGSWDANGSVRRFFRGCSYLGVDIASGAGVDSVVAGQSLDRPSSHFDTAISCECLEHNPFWLECFVNMLRMLKPGGLCIVTCATTGRREHGTLRMLPVDSLTVGSDLPEYYRNLTAADFQRRLDLDLHFVSHVFERNFVAQDLYFVGVKRGTALTAAEFSERMEGLRRAVHEQVAAASTVRKAKAMIKQVAARALGPARYRELDYFYVNAAKPLRSWFSGSRHEGAAR